MTPRPYLLALFLTLAYSVDAFAQSTASPEREVAVGLGPAFGTVVVGEHGDYNTGLAGHVRVGLGRKQRWSVDVDLQPFQATDPIRPQAVISMYVVPSYRIGMGRGSYLRIGAGAAFRVWSDSAHPNDNDIASQPDARHASPQVKPALGLTLGYQFRKPGAGFAIAPEAFLHLSTGDALVVGVVGGGVRMVASWYLGSGSASR